MELQNPDSSSASIALIETPGNAPPIDILEIADPPRQMKIEVRCRVVRVVRDSMKYCMDGTSVVFCFFGWTGHSFRTGIENMRWPLSCDCIARLIHILCIKYLTPSLLIDTPLTNNINCCIHIIIMATPPRR